MAFDGNGKLVIADTGWFSWEEINSAGPGANFGWPFYQGGDNGVLVRSPGFEDLPEAAAFYAAVENGTIEVTAAFRAFSHNNNDPGFQNQAITGADSVYTGSRYPAAFQNDYFFTDIVEGEVFSVDINDRREVQLIFRTGAGYRDETGIAPVKWSIACRFDTNFSSR